MEFLIDRLNTRTFAAIGALIALIFVVDRFWGYPVQWYERIAHPPVGRAVGGEDITAELERRRSVELHSLYQRVSREIAAAQAQGLDVGQLQALADQTLRFDTPAYRPAAIDRLNKLRLAIPQAPERLRAADPDEPEEEMAVPRSSRPRSR
jgi:hypothetical protein